MVAGRYRLVNRIGGGGIGVVRQAYDEWLHRKVAVKHLLIPAKLTGPQTEEARQRAMREGRIAAKLAHPHAIGVYDVLEDRGGRGIALKIRSSPRPTARPRKNPTSPPTSRPTANTTARKTTTARRRVWRIPAAMRWSVVTSN